jgi:hypothetical protein
MPEKHAFSLPLAIILLLLFLLVFFTVMMLVMPQISGGVFTYLFGALWKIGGT